MIWRKTQKTTKKFEKHFFLKKKFLKKIWKKFEKKQDKNDLNSKNKSSYLFVNQRKFHELFEKFENERKFRKFLKGFSVDRAGSGQTQNF